MMARRCGVASCFRLQWGNVKAQLDRVFGIRLTHEKCVRATIHKAKGLEKAFGLHSAALQRTSEIHHIFANFDTQNLEV